MSAQSPDRCVELLGVMRWIYDNFSTALARLRTVDVDGITGQDSPAYQEFLAISGQSHEQILGLGVEASRVGVAASTRPHWHQPTEKHYIPLFPRLSSDWRSPEGTIAMEPDAFPRRAERFPVWHENSCAVDVLIFAALSLSAGVTQADAIPWSMITEMDPVTSTFLWLMQAEWERADDAGIQTIQRILSRTIKSSGRYPNTADALLAMDDLIADCLRGWPGFTFNEIQAIRCCDERLTISDSSTHRTMTTIALFLDSEPSQLRNLSDEVNAHFSWEQWKELPNGGPRTPYQKCSFKNCQQRPSTVCCVLDRLPARLILSLGAQDGINSVAREEDWKYFDDLVITHQTTNGEKRARYSVKVVVFHIFRTKHYFARRRWTVNGRDVIQDFDSIRGNGITTVPTVVENWTAGMNPDITVSHIFLEYMGSA